MNRYQTEVLEMGPLRGRREITMELTRTLRGQAKQLTAMLTDRDHKRLARSLERTAGTLEQIAQLPVDPASDYRGGEGMASSGSDQTAKPRSLCVQK